MLDPNGDGESLQKVPPGTFTFQRGDISKQQGLRLRIRIPDGVTNTDGRQLTVSDIYDTKQDKHIEYGSQFADYITMGVHGVAITGGKPAPTEFCVGEQNASGEAFSQLVPFLRKKIQTQASTFSRM